MKTTAYYLDAIRARYHVGSDRALAPLLKVSNVSVYRFRNGEDSFSARTALRVADLLGIDPAEVAVSSLAQRADRTGDAAGAELWRSLSHRLSRNCRH